MAKGVPVGYKFLIIVAAIIIVAQLYITTKEADLVTNFFAAKIDALERKFQENQHAQAIESTKSDARLDQYKTIAEKLSLSTSNEDIKKQIDLVRFDLMVVRAQIEANNVKREGILPEFASQWVRGQGGQDVYMYETHFHKLTEPGLFVEFGARDGIADSNTYLYEKAFNWTGVMIEAVYHDFQYLAANRPRASIARYVTQKKTLSSWFRSLAAGTVLLKLMTRRGRNRSKN